MEIPIAVGPSGNLQILDHLLMSKSKSHYGSCQKLRRSKGDNFYLFSTVQEALF